MSKDIKTQTKPKKITGLIVLTVLLWLISIGSFVAYKKFIETDFISYYEVNNLDYSIYVNETNEFYKNKILDKEINNYVTKYIDKINVDFDYMMNFDKEVDSIYKYKVIAELKIYDRNNNDFVMNHQDYTLVNNQEFTMQNTEKLKVSKSVDVDSSASSAEPLMIGILSPSNSYSLNNSLTSISTNSISSSSSTMSHLFKKTTIYGTPT